MNSELFYVGYRELFEKPERKGYTTLKENAGKFSYDDARNMTEFTCAHGYQRWYISCKALDSFDGEKLIPLGVY